MDPSIFFPIVFSLVAIAMLSTVEITLLKKLHRDWWKHRWVRRASYLLPSIGCAAIIAWTAGIFADAEWMVEAGAYSTASVFIVMIALMLSLPVSALMHGMASLRLPRSSAPAGSEASVTESRRRFVKTAAAAFPILAISGGGAGLAGSLREPLSPEITMSFDSLPPGLDGLRILQISDVHVGFYVGMPEYERIMEIASRQRADLVLLTGDISDRTDLYAEALQLAHAIPARYGIYASIGNHEYYRGITRILSCYEHGPIPLLMNSGAAVHINGATLYLAGADDPRTIRTPDPRFYADTIDAAMKDAPRDAFTVLMSHRPEGFDRAATMNIPLTLSGHTHGGQIGIGGRSALEPLGIHKYAWGRYTKGASQLYTTAGAGQWFPFRLGCPAEIPVYILKSGKPVHP